MLTRATRTRWARVPFVLALFAVAACDGPSRTGESNTAQSVTLEAPDLSASAPAEYAGLHNVVAYGSALYSGSVPHGEEGFESLARMGIRTIISVDGAQPEVEAAKAHGMRYVHLPIGYDGMAPERTLEIARAVHDLPGPIYLHCHHGKHRSAGAAGAAAVSLGMLTQDQALARMSVSGTAANYTGLFACVRAASPASPEVLARAAAEFPERARTTGLVQSMVEIDEAFESLKAIEKAGWKTPADHPDLVPAAVAGRMADLFRVLDEDPEVVAGSEEMRSWLREDAARSSRLEEGLLAPAPSHADLSALLKELNQSCKQCHAAYRD